jgi:hypothetical protein
VTPVDHFAALCETLTQSEDGPSALVSHSYPFVDVVRRPPVSADHDSADVRL